MTSGFHRPFTLNYSTDITLMIKRQLTSCIRCYNLRLFQLKERQAAYQELNVTESRHLIQWSEKRFVRSDLDLLTLYGELYD
jgi:hypothetical protein